MENQQNPYGQNPQQNWQNPAQGGQPNYGYQQPGFQPGPQQFTYDAYGNPIPADAKTIALLSHLSSVALYLITASTLSFLGPLIFWLIYRNKREYAFVTANSARAFNFNITVWAINLAAGLLALLTFGLGLPIAGLIWLATTVVVFVFHIIGAVKSNNGEVYNYPMQIRLLKD